MGRGAWWATVHGVAKSQTLLRDFTFNFHFHASEKEMAAHSSVLAWRIPGTGEPGGLPSMGSHRVGHAWSDLAAAATIFLLSDTHSHLRPFALDTWCAPSSELPELSHSHPWGLSVRVTSSERPFPITLSSGLPCFYFLALCLCPYCNFSLFGGSLFSFTRIQDRDCVDLVYRSIPRA